MAHGPPVKQRLIQTLGRSARLRVLNVLKRTQGLPVREIATRLGMSYMGVKGHCLDLEKRGLLDTWRSPQPRGRPHMLYRLTQQAHDLFPATSNEATIHLLEAAQRLFGASAPEKLLHVVFQEKTAQYLARLKGATLAERAKWFTRLRDHEGCMGGLETGEDGALRIVEHHSPILDLLQAYPIVARLEAEMFQRVLGVRVERTEQTASGLYACTFQLHG